MDGLIKHQIVSSEQQSLKKESQEKEVTNIVNIHFPDVIKQRIQDHIMAEVWACWLGSIPGLMTFQLRLDLVKNFLKYGTPVPAVSRQVVTGGRGARLLGLGACYQRCQLLLSWCGQSGRKQPACLNFSMRGEICLSEW